MNNGRKIPQIGLGTWELTDVPKLMQAIENAIEAGYRHIDTAMIYENEEVIGSTLQRIFKGKRISRGDLFVTSKLWNSDHGRADIAVRKTLADLQLDYLDLYLIHWPVTFRCEGGKTVRNEKGEPVLEPFDLKTLWTKMEEFVDQGLVRSIGVSNFGIENLKYILSFCRIKPAMNQFEMHPYLKQRDLIKFCFDNAITVTSYSSLGSQVSEGSKYQVRGDKDILEIANRNKISPSQVILSWIAEKGIAVIPRSSNKDHLRENFELKQLSEDDIKVIENINIECRYITVPTFGPDRFK